MKAMNHEFGNKRQSTSALSHKLMGKLNVSFRVRMTDIQMVTSSLYKCNLLGVTWTVDNNRRSL